MRLALAHFECQSSQTTGPAVNFQPDLSLWTARTRPPAPDLRCRVMPSLTSAPLPSGLSSLRRRWRGFIVLHRRGLLALAAGMTVLVGLRAVAPPDPPRTEVVVASVDLPGGEVLDSHDLAVRRVPTELLPTGAASSAAEVEGRTLAAPVRAGEVLTDRRVVAPGLLADHPATGAVPVRLPDAGVRQLLRVGDRVDLVAASPRGASAAVVAEAVAVLAMPTPAGGGVGTDGQGALVVVAVPEHQALGVAQAASAGLIGAVLLR
jgi:Flp pilus assembly protein CpaB